MFVEYELRFEDDIAKKVNFPAERSNVDDISDELYELYIAWVGQSVQASLDPLLWSMGPQHEIHHSVPARPLLRHRLQVLIAVRHWPGPPLGRGVVTDSSMYYVPLLKLTLVCSVFQSQNVKGDCVRDRGEGRGDV